MQDSYYKGSMYDKAKELHLPASFVELRHEAIHGEIPSLVVLRQAAQQALGWLQTNYWKHINDECLWADGDLSCTGGGHTSKRVDLKNVVQLYTDFHANASSKRDRNLDDEPRITESILQILEESEWSTQALAEFVGVLLDHWMLLCASNEDKTAMMPNAGFHRCRRDDAKDAICDYWEPILKVLAVRRPSLLRMLSAVMIKHLTAPSTLSSAMEIFRNLILAMLNHIYTSSDWHKAYGASGLHSVKLVSTCLQSPNRWTIRLAAAVSDCPQHARVNRAFAKRIDQTMKSLETGKAAAAESADSQDDVPEKSVTTVVGDRRRG
ncbi:MAG: hypothetical protein Q9168_000053 [Polycauliona sp. 1 TL-2023]